MLTCDASLGGWHVTFDVELVFMFVSLSLQLSTLDLVNTAFAESKLHTIKPYVIY